MKKSGTNPPGKTKQTVIEAPVSEEREQDDKAQLIEMAIRKMEKKLASDEVKASIGDFIRLLQLQKDFYGDQPRQVTVKWVESTEKDCVPDK
ncbi:MAG: hypothetical protein M3Z23_05155 [Acidobacteriota bacterium]|nr:hypothetical protein [Acidobacteriota bacterium]